MVATAAYSTLQRSFSVHIAAIPILGGNEVLHVVGRRNDG